MTFSIMNCVYNPTHSVIMGEQRRGGGWGRCAKLSKTTKGQIKKIFKREKQQRVEEEERKRRRGGERRREEEKREMSNITAVADVNHPPVKTRR